MPLYHLYDTHSRPYEVSVESDSVLDAPSALDWSIGLPFAHVRNWCERRGWIVVPVEVHPDRTEVTFQGSTYRIHFRHGRVEGVTRDGEAVKWVELPRELKGLL